MKLTKHALTMLLPLLLLCGCYTFVGDRVPETKNWETPATPQDISYTTQCTVWMDGEKIASNFSEKNVKSCEQAAHQALSETRMFAEMHQGNSTLYPFHIDLNVASDTGTVLFGVTSPLTLISALTIPAVTNGEFAVEADLHNHQTGKALHIEKTQAYRQWLTILALPAWPFLPSVEEFEKNTIQLLVQSVIDEAKSKGFFSTASGDSQSDFF
jgi:hypothetical protein